MVSEALSGRAASPDSRPFWIGVGLLILGLVVASGLVILRGSHAGIRVRELSPAPGATASVRPAIRVRFVRPMERASVEQAISIQPEVPFAVAWRDNELRLLPTAPLQAGTRYTISIGPGVRDARGEALEGQLEWSFATRQPRIAYVRFTEGMHSELWMSEMGGEGARRLSAPGQAVQAFDAAPDGSVVAYTVEEGENTVNLWRAATERNGLTRLTSQQGVVYGAPRFGPSGDLLALEVRQAVQVADRGAQLAPPRLELRRPTDGSPAGLLYGGQGNVAHSPRWSPDGTRLVFYEANRSAIGLFNFTTDVRFFPGESALLGQQSWSPDGRALVYTAVTFSERGAQQSVVLRDLEMGTEHNVGESVGDQADPAWSPDGALIAYAYKPPPGATLGSGIWLMRPDGTGRVLLVSEPEAIFSLPLWSPDGEWLLFGRFDLASANPTQSLWLIHRDGSGLRQVTHDGFQPAWVP